VRLPSRVTLPFGYIIQVKQLTDAEMLDEQDECDREELLDGLWDADTRTIFVRASLPMGRRRYILGHEIGHAFIDWQHHCLNEDAMKP
jgi:Zn-dependent peptidase ImmA (M78 family)